MKTIRPLICRAGAALLALAVLSQASAQMRTAPEAEVIDPTTGLPASPVRHIPETWQKKIKSRISFDRLTLGEIVNFLEGQVPEINFVITEDASAYEVPPIRLNSVTLEDVFTAIRILSKGEVQISPESDTMVSFTLIKAQDLPQKPKKQFVAYSLNSYLQGKSGPEVEKSMKDLEEALARSWDLLAMANNMKYERPALSLHAPTKMLIAAGEPDQLQVIDQIVRQLKGGFGMGGGGGGGGLGAGPIDPPPPSTTPGNRVK